MAIQISGSQIQSAAVIASKVNFTDSSQWHFGSNQSLQWAGAASNANDLVTKKDLDGVAAGLHWKESVRARSTTNLNLSNPGTAAFDSQTCGNGDRILIMDQSDASQNGIYQFNGSGSAMTRTSDMNADAEFPGAACFVREGTLHADTGWVCTNDAVTVGDTDIAFTQFSGASNTAAGVGLMKSSNTISVKLDGSTITATTDGVKVTAGSLTNAEINASANIAYSKLNLTGSVANADLAGSIADSKLLDIVSAGKVKGTAVELKAGGPLANSSGLTINALGVTNGMLAGSIAITKLAAKSITITDGSTAQAIDLGGTITYTAGSGLSVSQSGGTVTIAGVDATTSGKGVASFASANFNVASGAVSAKPTTYTAGNGLSGGGTAAPGGTVSFAADVDNTSIGFSAGTNKIELKAVSLGKLSYKPYQEQHTATAGQTDIELDRALTADWDKAVQIFKNGLAIKNRTAIGGSPADSDDFTVSISGGTGGVGKVTFGSGLSVGDNIVISYIA